MSNIPKMTNPNQVWIVPTWNLRDEVAKAASDYVESMNDMLEMSLMRQRPTKSQITRSHKAINRLYAVIKAIPDDIAISGEPPLS